MARTGETCAACGTSLEGLYCHGCGERRPQPEDESLGRVLREAFHDVTSADGKLWRSLQVVFVPGRLTTEYFSGRRGRYLRPVRLFLAFNVILFFLLGFLQRNPLVGELNLQRRSLGNVVAEAADAKLAAWGGAPTCSRSHSTTGRGRWRVR